MTRIFTDGAEFNDTLFFTSASCTVSAAQKRSGSYSYQLNTLATYKDVAEASSGYFREGVRLNYSAATSANNYQVAFRNGSTIHVSVYYSNTTGKFGINAGGVSSVDETTNPFISSVWYLMEVYVEIGGSGVVIVKIDGVEEINWSGDTQNGATTTFDNIAWYNNANSNFWFDDLAYNDTNGLTDNSWCGDGCVEVLMPNADGDTNAWTGSDGDSVSNYLLVDERGHDSDTTYVKATTAVKDMYNVSDYTGTNKIVTRIWAECRAKDAEISTGAIKIGYKHGGVEYLSSYKSLSGAYARVVGDEATSDPSDSTTWSEADLDAIQFVVENSSSSSTTSSSSSSSSTTSSSSSTEIP